MPKLPSALTLQNFSNWLRNDFPSRCLRPRILEDVAQIAVLGHLVMLFISEQATTGERLWGGRGRSVEVTQHSGEWYVQLCGVG